MKKIIIFLMITTLITSISCTKYYFDSGVHEAKYDGTVWDYMESRKPYFDSTMTVIELAGMKNVFENENITFFAPPGGTIFRAVHGLNQYLKFHGKDTVSQLNQISPEVWKSTLSDYVFKGSNLLKDYPQRDTVNFLAFPGQNYTSYSGRIMNIGVIYQDAGGVTGAGYRQLFLAYIPDFSNPQNGLTNIPIATSDIQPRNGVIHALNRLKHTYGFRRDKFIDQVIAAGITPAQP